MGEGGWEGGYWVHFQAFFHPFFHKHKIWQRGTASSTLPLLFLFFYFHLYNFSSKITNINTLLESLSFYHPYIILSLLFHFNFVQHHSFTNIFFKATSIQTFHSAMPPFQHFHPCQLFQTSFHPISFSNIIT